MRCTNYFLLCLLLCFLFFNCAPEDEFIRSTNKELKITQISFNELKSKASAYNKFKSIVSTPSTAPLQRVVYTEEYGFYYDIDKILHITKDDFESFTIPVIKMENDSLLKNLVLYRKGDAAYNVKLMGYKLTDDEMHRIANGEAVPLHDKVYVENPIENTENFDSWTWIDDSGCITTATVFNIPGPMCSEGVHSWGHTEPCTADVPAGPPQMVIHLSYAFCDNGPNSGGGPTPPPTGPTNPGPGTGTSDPNPNPVPIQPPPSEEEVDDEVITVPVVPGFDQEIPPRPCDELKKLIDRVGFRSRMQTLANPSNFTAGEEVGWAETIITNNVGALMSQYPVGIPKGPDKLYFDPDYVLYGYAHIHHDDYSGAFDIDYKIARVPSPADIEFFAERLQTGAANLGKTSKDTYGFTVTSAGTYCLKMLVNNPSQSNFIYIDFNTYQEEFEEAFENLVKKNQHTQANVEKLWLNFLETYKLSDYIGLYKTNDPNFNNWSRLTINSYGELEPPTPCP